jgi:uncharacterized protein YegL
MEFMNRIALACLGLLILTMPAQGEDVIQKDNVVVILDASGSMKERMTGTRVVKMDAAKAALKEVLKLVPETTNIGLLVFSGRNVPNEWVYPLGPRDDAKLVKAIDLPVPAGKTPLGAYIKKGADRLLEERAERFGYGTYRLLIVTDGEAQDQHLVSKYTPEVVARGITVDVIGVGMKRAHTLATKVHSYRSANDPTALKAAVAEVFAEVGGTGSDAASEEAFEILASIPDGIAEVMIEALTASGNHPIGEKPRTVMRSAKRAKQESRPATNRQTPTAPPTPATPAADSGSSGVGGTILIVIIIMVIAIVGKIARKSGSKYR